MVGQTIYEANFPVKFNAGFFLFFSFFFTLSFFIHPPPPLFSSCGRN